MQRSVERATFTPDLRAETSRALRNVARVVGIAQAEQLEATDLAEQAAASK